MLETGQKIGKYEIIGLLGAGGEGSVYLAKDMALSRLAAIKQVAVKQMAVKQMAVREGMAGIDRVLSAGEENRETNGGESGQKGEMEILQEAAFLRDLQHPMLPIVYDLLYVDDWYLVMEYIEGISLHNYIEKRGGVGEEQGCIWAETLLSFLEYLHNRKPPVIYRDLKPDNMIVCPDKRLRLVDLGAACLKSYGENTKTRMALTPGYGAPEQQAVSGKTAYADERSDIYAFGKVLYYILTGADPGRPPYGSLPVSVYDPLTGDDLERIIQKCTRENPEERYQVVEEIRDDLSGRKQEKRGYRRKNFLRHMEKKVWLTEQPTAGLL